MTSLLNSIMNITSNSGADEYVKCGVCTQTINEEEDTFECDLCDKTIHMSCAEGKKSELKARKGSKTLKIFCPTCRENEKNVTPNKLNEIVRMVYKIDMSCQEKKASEQCNNQILNEMMKMMQNMMEKVDNFDERLRKIESTANVSRTYDAQPSTSSSFVDIVKAGVPKSAVVVKPKQKQPSKTTMEQITTAVDTASVSVCNTRNARDGGIVLCCKNTADTMKVKEIVREKLGDGYDVTLPTVKNPRLRITNINTAIPDDSIIDELKKYNDIIANDELKLVTIIPRKFRDSVSNDIIVEVKSDTYKKLLHAGALNLPWRECKVLQHLYIKRCFKCCGFSHTAQQCKQNNQYCSKCAGNHKFDSCRSRRMCCINCKVANEKYGLNLNTEHHAWSKDCKVLSRRMQTLREKIEYNAAE